jgi:hypothetical protein
MPSNGRHAAVISVRPQLADNIGMTARAMANFGLSRAAPVTPATAGPTRRPASPPPAPTSSSMRPRPIPRSRTASRACIGCAPPPPVSATSPRPC